MFLIAALSLVLPVHGAATLKFDAPTGWVSKAPASTMRVAEWSLPKVAGDAEDADVTLYFFGANQGGNVQANLDRWIGQMSQPDARASKDVAKTSTLTSHGLKVTLVDVTGHVRRGGDARVGRSPQQARLPPVRRRRRDAGWSVFRETHGAGEDRREVAGQLHGTTEKPAL